MTYQVVFKNDEWKSYGDVMKNKPEGIEFPNKHIYYCGEGFLMQVLPQMGKIAQLTCFADDTRCKSVGIDFKITISR